MFAAKIISMLSATALAIDFNQVDQAGDDASLHCLDNTPFCQRTREWKLDQADISAPKDISYKGSSQPVVHNADGQTYIDFDLSMSCEQSGYLASSLQVRLEFYQNGIMRVAIDQPDSTRFRISGEDLPVEWDQLKGVDQDKFAKAFKLTEDGFSVTGLTRDDDEEDNSVYDYHVTLQPFGIRQMTNGELTSSTHGQLYFENMSATQNSSNTDTCFDALKSRAQDRSGSNIYDNESGTVKQAVSMSFYLPGEEQTLYGIPEREDTLALKTTTGTDPYQMFATDHLHAPNEVGPLYGSVPYIMGLSDKAATSFLWVNSAKTTVDIDRPEEVPADIGKKGAQVTFASEANVIEFFMFTSSAQTQKGKTNRVKQVNKDLATISGFAPMPLLHTLGYHFCKWAPVSADMLMDRNRKFTDNKFPIDVLWSDIEWAQQYGDPAGYEYFKFNPQNFTDTQIEQMNSEIEEQGRRIVVIVDPHIKVSDDYFVYSEGIEMQNQEQPAGNFSNIFIRENADSPQPFEGDCWPGNSVWIDFLNTNAQNFWGSLFDYNVFKGSNYMYSFWNDMNEPAVFSTDSHTMPLDAVHIKADGTKLTHLEVHNAYGALHQRSSYRGLLKRDNDTQRPFVLTRSFFLGSQKFGAYWTGDNRSVFEELQGSISMIMQLGNAGHPFGGSDIPGFYGSPTDDLFVMFYQVGMWYPFFRAHSQDVSLPFPLKDREPWMQTSRVREAIRDSINRRYDLIHYIYSTVETTTQTAEPLMRPMWSEFPNESRFWDVASQFMFGSSILVAPKVTRPQGVYKHMHMQEVTYALPEGESWFNYYSKASVESTPQGEWVTDALPDLEQAVFVRGGTVLPIMMHDDCPSILACIDNDVKLEIYPDADSNATGTLYLDDGSSYEFVDKDAKSARVTYSYNGGMISTSLVHGDDYQNFPNVSSIVVYGVGQQPEVCRTGAGEQLSCFHEASTQSLYIQMQANTSSSDVDVLAHF